MSETKSSKTVVLRDLKTNTIWKQDGEDNCCHCEQPFWKCGVCEGELQLCRGCGGFSMMYDRLFGSCGDLVLCPNCTTLSEPDITWHDNTPADEYWIGVVMDYEENTHKHGELSFLTYTPHEVKGLRRYDPYCGDCEDLSHKKYCETCAEKFDKTTSQSPNPNQQTSQPCQTCNGYGLWAVGDDTPMGSMDASEGLPTKPCPECKANANP